MVVPSASKGASYAIPCLKFYPMCLKWLETKHDDAPAPSNAPTFKSMTGMHASTIEHSVFSVMAGLIVGMLFVLFSIYDTV